MADSTRPALLVLASTYPRWRGDHEPGFVHELCKRLTTRFEVTVVTSRAQHAAAREIMDGVNVERYAYAPSALEKLVYGGGIAANLRRAPWKLLLVPAFVLGCWLAARRVVRTRSIAVIHAHWLIPQGLVARSLSFRLGIPFCVTSHGGDLFGLRGAWLTRRKRIVARSASAMTVVSSAMRAEVKRLELNPQRIEVMPMGVDMLERFTPDSDTARAADELLFVGRLVAKKGLPHLLNALPAVLCSRPSVTLTIAGFGPEEAALRAQAARLGIEARVHFSGPVAQDQLPSFYRRAALFVGPFVRDASGDQEGLPVVLMEAIACGCPVIAGDVAGVRDLLGDAAADVCVSPTNEPQLAAAILAVLAEPAIAQQRALRLRDAVIADFDWTVISRRYADLIQECLTRRRHEHFVTDAEQSHSSSTSAATSRCQRRE